MKTKEINIKITKDGGMEYTNTEGKASFDERGFIDGQRELLISYRDDGRKLDQNLLDDIAAYEYLLEGEDSEDKLKIYEAINIEYIDKRQFLRPRETVKIMKEASD